MTISNPDTPASHWPLRYLREIIAIILWTFIVVKVIVFDIDVYVFERYLPSLRWLLNYRFFGLLLIVAAALIGTRWKPFRRFLIYIICYPLIILLWRLPKLFFRNWALTIAFAPAIYDLLRSFRSRFAILTAAALAAICIILSSSSYSLLPSMVVLGAYLVMHLFRSLRKAYKSSLFEGLGGLVKKLRVSLESEQQGLWKKEKYEPDTKDYEQQCLAFYLLNWGLEIFGEKLIKVAKSRKPDLYLMFSWFVTVLLTSLIYALQYWALYKIDMSSFRPDYTFSFWSFLGYSFGKLTPSSLSAVTPMNVAATILSYSELFCALIIFVILVFSVLTAAREKYREDIADFVSELGYLGKYLQNQFYHLYAIAVADVEIILLTSNTELINKLRQVRGLPPLSLPEKEGQPKKEASK